MKLNSYIALHNLVSISTSRDLLNTRKNPINYVFGSFRFHPITTEKNVTHFHLVMYKPFPITICQFSLIAMLTVHEFTTKESDHADTYIRYVSFVYVRSFMFVIDNNADVSQLPINWLTFSTFPNPPENNKRKCIATNQSLVFDS